MRMLALAPALLLAAVATPAAADGAASSSGQHYCVREEIARRLSQPWDRGPPRVDRPAPDRVTPLDRLPQAQLTKTVLCRPPYDVRDLTPARASRSSVPGR